MFLVESYTCTYGNLPDNGPIESYLLMPLKIIGIDMDRSGNYDFL